MNRLILLTGIFLKTGLRGTKLAKSKYANYLLLPLILLSFTPLLLQYSEFIRKGYDALEQIGQQGILISLALGVNCLVIFFFGIFMALGTFYFSKDIENLLPMPIKPFEMIGAKFLTIVIYEYLLELFVFAPVVINYGISSGAGPDFYAASAIIFILLPVIPLVLSSLISILLMSFTTLSRNKDRYIYFVGILGILIGLGFNMIIQKSMGEGLDAAKLRDLLLRSDNSLIDVVSKLFPGSGLAVKAIVHNTFLQGLGSLALFILITAAIFTVFLFIAQKLYFRGVVNITDSASKRKDLSEDMMDKITKTKSNTISYMLVEIKTLVRTPSFFLNCVLGNFIFPILLIFFFLLKDSEMGSALELLKGLLNEDEGKTVFQNVLIGLSIFISVTNGIASTTISREGKGLFFKKFIPMPYMAQIRAKLLSAMLFSLSGMLSIYILMVILLDANIGLILLCMPGAIAGMMLASMTGILIDLNNPKLGWDSEQAAVKQNMNLLLNMLLGVILAVLIFLASKAINAGYIFGPLIIAAGLTIIDYILYRYIEHSADRFYEKILT